jgi:hypothetical protein
MKKIEWFGLDDSVNLLLLTMCNCLDSSSKNNATTSHKRTEFKWRPMVNNLPKVIIS